MRAIRYVSVMLICVLLPGCSLLAPVNLPPIQSYSLMNSTVVPERSQHRSDDTLLVAMPIADTGFDSNQMIYEKTNYNLQAYADHQWAAPPAVMLMPLLANALREQGYFKAVVIAPFSGTNTYYLTTRLMSLKQNFLHPTSQEEWVLQETLIKSTTNQVIASQLFSVTVPAPGNNAYAGVIAANRGALQLSHEIAVWVIHSI